MNIDYQVLTLKTKIKSRDIGGLGMELDVRKGSGNYDKNRTQFNIEYVGFDGHTTLKSKVNYLINNKKIHYNKGHNTNLLNGCIVTSGPDFFQKLGLPMKATDRIHKEGKHIGEPILCPDLKAKEDIPNKVYEFFNESYNFVSNYVGKDNIVYASIHMDEDTPHLHIYWLPVVDSVQRKLFQTDENGKRITKEIVKEDGTIKQIPVLSKDPNGKQIYKIEYGNFLDNDQFWKQRGGLNSYAKMQDAFNEYITSKGFDLDRGKIGAHKQHQEKLEYTIKLLKEEANQLENQIALYEQVNASFLETNEELHNLENDEILNPSKNMLNRYSSKDVDKLIDKAKNISKENINNKRQIKNKDAEIEKLKKEIKNYKTGELQDKIYEQEVTIKSQKEEIKSISEEFNNFKKFIYRIVKKCFKVIQLIFGMDKEKIESTYEKEEKNGFINFEGQLDNLTHKYSKQQEKNINNELDR